MISIRASGSKKKEEVISSIKRVDATSSIAKTAQDTQLSNQQSREEEEAIFLELDELESKRKSSTLADITTQISSPKSELVSNNNNKKSSNSPAKKRHSTSASISTRSPSRISTESNLKSISQSITSISTGSLNNTKSPEAIQDHLLRDISNDNPINEDNNTSQPSLITDEFIAEDIVNNGNISDLSINQLCINALPKPRLPFQIEEDDSVMTPIAKDELESYLELSDIDTEIKKAKLSIYKWTRYYINKLDITEKSEELTSISNKIDIHNSFFHCIGRIPLNKTTIKCQEFINQIAQTSMFTAKHKRLDELIKDKLKNINKQNIHECRHAIFHAMNHYNNLKKDSEVNNEDWRDKVVTNLQKKIKSLRQIYIEVPESKRALIDSKMLELNELIIMTMADIRKNKIQLGIKPLIFEAILPYISELHSDISYRTDCQELFDNFTSLLEASTYMNMRSQQDLQIIKDNKRSAKELNRVDNELKKKFKSLSEESNKIDTNNSILSITPIGVPKSHKKKSLLSMPSSYSSLATIPEDITIASEPSTMNIFSPDKDQPATSTTTTETTKAKTTIPNIKGKPRSNSPHPSKLSGNGQRPSRRPSLDPTPNRHQITGRPFQPEQQHPYFQQFQPIPLPMPQQHHHAAQHHTIDDELEPALQALGCLPKHPSALNTREG